MVSSVRTRGSTTRSSKTSREPMLGSGKRVTFRSKIRRSRRRLGRRLQHTRLWTALKYVKYTAKYRRAVLVVIGALVGLGAVWICITGLLAKQEADRISSRLQEVRILVSLGRVDDARAIASTIPSMSARAHRLTSGPAWWVGSNVPFLGSPLAVAREVTAVQDEVGSRVIPPLVHAAQGLDPSTLRASGSQIRLAPLINARPALRAADVALRGLEGRVAQNHTNSWFGAVNALQDDYASRLSRLAGYVDAANRAADILPEMLGGSSAKSYFIALQNEAELRGTGGLPGAFATATAAGGKIHFTGFYSDSRLTGKSIPTALDFGEEYDSLYAASTPTSTYTDSNASPNFPYAAQIWATMWQRVSGQHVSGVLAVDPTALSYFLRAVGPAQLTGGGVVDADNVVSLTEKNVYTLIPDNAARKDFLVTVMKAAANKLTSGSGSPDAVLRAAARASSERRLLAWDRDPQIEKALAQTTYGGVIGPDRRPFGAMIVNNAAAGKLDYYLGRSMSYSRTGCGPSRDVYVTMSLRNNAPGSGLPKYVYGRADRPPPNYRPGDNHSLVDYYATGGSSLRSVTIDGLPATAAVYTSLGRVVYRFDLEIKRGETRTVVLHLVEPAADGDPVIWQQPGVTPLQLKYFNQHC